MFYICDKGFFFLNINSPLIVGSH